MTVEWSRKAARVVNSPAFYDLLSEDARALRARLAAAESEDDLSEADRAFVRKALA